MEEHKGYFIEDGRLRFLMEVILAFLIISLCMIGVALFNFLRGI